MYSGKPLDIRGLPSYQVDHIIPQSYIKDDSLENKVLVFAEENQAKSNELLIDQNIRKKMRSYWKALYDAKLIGEKKFDNLMRTHISQKKMGGFTGRQLVETAQITKLTKMMLENRLADKSGMCSVRILPIKASLSHNLREIKGYARCREINDFHHAHDALLAAEVGRFILKRHAAMYDNPVGYARVVKDFIRAQAMEI